MRVSARTHHNLERPRTPLLGDWENETWRSVYAVGGALKSPGTFTYRACVLYPSLRSKPKTGHKSIAWAIQWNHGLTNSTF